MVSTGYGVYAGGSGERSYQMARHLLEAGEDVRMLITDKWARRPDAIEGHPFPSERLTVLPLLERRFDIPLLAPWVIRRAVRDADVIHVDYLSPVVPAVCAAARRLGKPWVVCPAGAIPFIGRSQRLKRVFHRLWGARILHQASRVVAITAREAERLRPFVPAPERIMIVPNAIDAPAPDHDGIDPDRPTILCLGGFAPAKGADLLVRAFASLGDDARAGHILVMAGVDSPERRAVQKLAHHLGAGDVIRFPGWLAGRDRARALAASSFVAIPSIHDSMTMVALHAAAAEKPLLMTSTCGFAEVAQAGAGQIVEPTVADLSAGLRSMIENRARWPEMGRAGASLAARYAWAVMTERYRLLFRQAIDDHHR